MFRSRTIKFKFEMGFREHLESLFRVEGAIHWSPKSANPQSSSRVIGYERVGYDSDGQPRVLNPMWWVKTHR